MAKHIKHFFNGIGCVFLEVPSAGVYRSVRKGGFWEDARNMTSDRKQLAGDIRKTIARASYVKK